MKNKLYFLFVKKTEKEAKLESRRLLREAVEEFFRRENLPREEVLYTPLGKPYFPSGKFFLSVTHTGNLFAAVFAPVPIGIDGEKITVEKEGVALRFFDEKERNMPFSKVWTAKEAVSKIDGRGLSVVKKVKVEEDFAFLEEKKYLLERHTEEDYLLTVALYLF
ncbi:MAG: 4'-phosphopantetheinyl transferase superfamily protein [Clostridia bacterium]|nr:4'-phosphopantetheinyl transferase superfamily protein [Clostridia bacterium]